LSLRMNLFGWSLRSFRDVLGSGNSSVLKAATQHLTESVRDEPALARSKAWLHKLVQDGFPLRDELGPRPEPADGGLVTVQMETQTHVYAVNSLVRAIRRDDFIDLSNESSNWKHPSVGALYQELSGCGFARSRQCCPEYFNWMSKLSNGSPLFGDDFRTEWSYYTFFVNEDLAAMIPVFQAAADFKRPLPEGMPAEVAGKFQTGLLESGKEFIGDLIKWFTQLQESGQDAFILWW
jgi:hypothetical protein